MTDLLKRRSSDEITVATASTVEASSRRSFSTVRFSSLPNDVHLIENLADADRTDVRNKWYDADEIAALKSETASLVKKMKNNVKIESSKESARGLERWTFNGIRRRKVNRLLSLKAIMEEQERQRETGEEDARLLAKAYATISRPCQAEAYQIGLQDEAAIKKDLEKFQKSMRTSATNSTTNVFRRLSQRLSFHSVGSNSCDAVQ